MRDHYDVGVVGVWPGWNYGSLLNGYAGYVLLKSLNQRVLMISKMYANRDSMEKDLEKSKKWHNTRFVAKYYDKEDVSPVLSYEQLPELNRICDCFCAGSDQIWNYGISSRENMYLPFVQDGKKIISLATSFGHKKDFAPIDAQVRIRKYLQRFSAISLREQFSVDLLKEQYDLKGELVFDPVFCIDKKNYYDLAEKSDFPVDKPYLLTYILDPTPEKREAVLYYADKLGLRTVNLMDGDMNRAEQDRKILDLPNSYVDYDVEDFLKAYIHAAFIITDSFHGSAFSIIFNKPFIAVANPRRGAVRFNDILGRTGLMERLVPNQNHIPHDEKYLRDIDYTETNRIVEREAKHTVDWLKWALETPIDKMPSIILLESEELARKKAEQQKALQAETENLHKNEDFIKIRILATLLRDYGVKHVVLSPGGRDVPLVRMFEYNEKHFILHRITDERSAAYFALGIAAQMKTPVACVCTSGTAASNFLPAITEAFYTHVPLIAITADRYTVYHEQGEDQTIPQSHIYDGVIKKSVTLPEGTGYRAEYQARRDISECILETTHHVPGPVHINVAIGNITQGAKAPAAAWSLLPKIYPHILRAGWDDGEKKLLEWVTALKRSQRILVVYGQNPPPTEGQKRYIEEFAKKYNCVIITDPISNLHCAYSMQPHNMLSAINQEQFNKELSPDILITVGGKRLMNDPLTAKIRGGLGNIRNWHVTPDGKVKDFYFRLTSVIEMSQESFFQWFSEHAGNSLNNGVYYGQWLTLKKKYQASAPVNFNTDYVLSESLPKIPEGSLLHLGVGVTFYNCRKYSIPPSVEVYCNMGTNGIDGCTSTFMGQCSVVQDRLCFLIVGDLSFFYDMNSIWNKHPENNVRILMINNNGTGLLRGHGLKGISSVHNTSAKGWVESTCFAYLCARDKEDLGKQLAKFLDPNSDAPLFLEVFCD